MFEIINIEGFESFFYAIQTHYWLCCSLKNLQFLRSTDLTKPILVHNSFQTVGLASKNINKNKSSFSDFEVRVLKIQTILFGFVLSPACYWDNLHQNIHFFLCKHVFVEPQVLFDPANLIAYLIQTL